MRTGDAVAWLWQRALQADLRTVILVVVAAVMFQQHQIVQAQEKIVALQTNLEGVQEIVETGLVLDCLDSTKTRDLQVSKAPCARLFDKFGIQR